MSDVSVPPSRVEPQSSPERSVAGSLPMGAMLAIALVAALVRIGPEALETYHPGCDEAHMLQAAVRLTRGQGLTVTWQNPVEDLAEPTYVHAYAWPPVYSWIVAGLLRLGVGYQAIMDGLKLLKFAAVFAGVLGWLRLGSRCLPTGWAWLYAAGVPGLLFVEEHSDEFGPSHLFAWALLPWMVDRVLAGLERSADPHGPSPWRDWLLAGLLGVAMISARYVVHLPVAAAATVLLCSGGPWWRRLVGSAMVSAPSAAVYEAFRAYNVSVGAPAGWLDAFLPVYDWSIVDLTEPLRALSLFGLGVADSIRSLSPTRVAMIPSAVWTTWELLLLGVAACGLLCCWRSHRDDALGGEPRRPLGPVIVFAVVGWLANTAMVTVMSARMYATVEQPNDWLPQGEVRYFSEVTPLLGLVGAAALAALAQGRWVGLRPSGLGWLAAALALVVVVMECRMLIRGVRGSLRPIRAALAHGVRVDPPLELLVRESAAELSARTGEPIRVFDFWGPVGIPRWNRDDSCGAHRCDDAEVLGKAHCSRPTWVFVVVRWSTNRKRTEAKWEWQTGQARAIVDWLGVPPDAAPWRTLWDHGQFCQVFLVRVEPYPAGARGRPHIPLPDAYPPPELTPSP